MYLTCEDLMDVGQLRIGVSKEEADTMNRQLMAVIHVENKTYKFHQIIN